MLESIGHETRLILIDPDLSGRFTHVIAQVKIGDKWYWMETTKKVPFSWAPKFTISHIIDKDSIAVRDMDELDNLFGLGDLGRRGGGGNRGGSRSSGSRSSSSRSSSRSSRSAARSGGSSVLSRIRSSASNAGQEVLRSELVKRRDGILDRFRKGQITKPKAREEMQRLKAKGMLASKKLQVEKVKAIAPIVAFEAKK